MYVRSATFRDTFNSFRNFWLNDLINKRRFSIPFISETMLYVFPPVIHLYVLYVQDDENLPDKATDVYMKLIRCLINREKSAQVSKNNYRDYIIYKVVTKCRLWSGSLMKLP